MKEQTTRLAKNHPLTLSEDKNRVYNNSIQRGGKMTLIKK